MTGRDAWFVRRRWFAFRWAMFLSLGFGVAPSLQGQTPLVYDPAPDRIAVATWNLEWFFDAQTGDNDSALAKKLSAPTQQDWDWKLAAAAKGIATLEADVVALQEIEGRRVLVQLAKRLNDDHGQSFRVAFVEGADVFTEQDVGFLVRSGLVETSRREQSKAMFESHDFFDLSKHAFCRLRWSDPDGAVRELHLLTAHFRAGADKADLRLRQARLARGWVDELSEKGAAVIVLGDFNFERPVGDSSPDLDSGTLSGASIAGDATDWSEALALLPADQQATHQNGKSFDRIYGNPIASRGEPGGWKLVSCAIRKDACVRGDKADQDHGERYWSIPADERDVSDHYPVVAVFERR